MDKTELTRKRAYGKYTIAALKEGVTDCRGKQLLMRQQETPEFAEIYGEMINDMLDEYNDRLKHGQITVGMWPR